MTQADSVWFHKSGAVGGPRMRLVCFPHAGGTPAFFRTWHRRLPADVEVLAVCYPARQHRLGEPPVDSMGVLADRIADALAPYADAVPLAFFGHSMGAGVAYEVARRLETRHDRGPIRLFASAFGAPHRRRPVLPPTDDAAMLSELRLLGSAAMAALDTPALADVVLPSLRADLRLVCGYWRPRAEPLSCPLVGYAGDEDKEEAGPEAMRAWGELTTSRFEHRVFSGHHFYLERGEAELLADISGRLTDDLRMRGALAAAHSRTTTPGGGSHE
ncbi:thioesterase II family protein [Streptomyces sp. NPDC059168]|uniref:thioesterase II family protein n=1 Tax=Streptomyces sp. NPDC059168 TaxID=3346753 RepID=UPI00367490D8